VCARAGLTDRYISESFTNRDELLVAVFDQALEEVSASVARAVDQAPADREARLRAAIGAVVDFVAGDAARARALLGNPGDASSFEKHRRRALQEGIAAVLEGARPDSGDAVAQMTALIGAGGLIEVLNAWLGGTLRVDAEAVITHVTHVAMALATVALPAEAE
jgi:AcrR family transcriptional regulator